MQKEGKANIIKGEIREQGIISARWGVQKSIKTSDQKETGIETPMKNPPETPQWKTLSTIQFPCNIKPRSQTVLPPR